MSTLSLSNGTVASALVSASKRYGVPIGTLLGVFGQETDFGRNVATSSAGAVGPFQFTAANKGTGVTYPMTNTPNAAQFGQQTDAAAAYLSSLYKQHGNNWDAALQAYSAGGYGQSQVAAQLSRVPGDLGTALVGASENQGGSSQVPGESPGSSTPIGAAKSALSGVGGAITGTFQQAVSDAKYAGVLIAALALGAMLIYRAFSSSSGGEKVKVVPV